MLEAHLPIELAKLQLQPNDLAVLKLQYEAPPERIILARHWIENFLSKLGYDNDVIVIDQRIDLGKLDPDQMRRLGWHRAVEPPQVKFREFF